MKKIETLINGDEIYEFFEENCEDYDFSLEDFDEFLAHLKLDFYQWLSDNMKSFKNDA